MCQTGSSRPAGREASTCNESGSAGSVDGVAFTGAERSPDCASSDASDETAYHAARPRSPVVSQYHGPGTASTSRPPWSTGSQGPSGESAR